MAGERIRTPDQRVRVFVSSTLGELATERQAVREAIERLHLAPVMFELGARPHPPRELYRAYLAQSHVFIGIYWQRYGWVAPGETVSGLEDEYRLAGDRPMLIYVKEPAPDREPRLHALLGDIKAGDRVSYRRFRTTEELARVVEDDLALLLSERFQTDEDDRGRDVAATTPPVPLTPTVGRDDDREAVVATLQSGARLVTLTGPGGIGKTRLALEVAQALSGSYRGGVHYVPLADVTEPDHVLPSIADRFHLHLEGDRAPLTALVGHLGARHTLLVLDNLEQVATVAPVLTDLLSRCPGLQILATSRQALRVRAEQEVRVEPLALPPPGAGPDEIAAAAAVEMFAACATAVHPSFRVDADTAPTVAELVRRLDGLPLAIELAAAQVRLLPPTMLLERLGGRLDQLAGGADLPDRQRTLRATMEWSYRLLDPDAQRLLTRLGVFGGDATLDAIEAVCADDGLSDVLGPLAALLDANLVRLDDDRDGPRFRMLETVRQFARELLSATNDADAVRRRHLEVYAGLCREAQPFLCGPQQRPWAARFEAERANVRAAVATALATARYETVIQMTWDSMVFFYIRDAVAEPEQWIRAVMEADPALPEDLRAVLVTEDCIVRMWHGEVEGLVDDLTWAEARLDGPGRELERAVVHHHLGMAWAHRGDTAAAVDHLERCAREYDLLAHDWGVATAETTLGSVLAGIGDHGGAAAHHQRALEHARRIDNGPLTVQALVGLANVHLATGDPGGALAPLTDAAAAVRRDRYTSGAAYCLETLGALWHTLGDVERALRAVATARTSRLRLGLTVWPVAEAVVTDITEAARRRLGEDAIAAMGDDAGDADPYDALDEGVVTARETLAGSPA